MSKLIVLITPQLETGYDIAERWQAEGAPGITLIDGYGLYSLQEATKNTEVMPGMLSMFEIVRSQQNNNLILAQRGRESGCCRCTDRNRE